MTYNEQKHLMSQHPHLDDIVERMMYKREKLAIIMEELQIPKEFEAALLSAMYTRAIENTPK